MLNLKFKAIYYKQMDSEQLRYEIKTAAGLVADGTWTAEDLTAKMMEISSTINDTAAVHKERLEKFVHYIEEIRHLQRQYFAGHKYVLSESKAKEKELDSKVAWLKVKGYNTDRFKVKSEQPKLF